MAKGSARYGRDEIEGAKWALEERAEQARSHEPDAVRAALQSVGIHPDAAVQASRDWAGCGRVNGDAATRKRERLAHATLVGMAIGAYIGTGEYDDAYSVNRSGGARVRLPDHHPLHGDTAKVR